MTVIIGLETEASFDFEYESVAKEVIGQAIRSEGFPYEAEIGLVIVDEEEIQRMNREFRGIDRPTDVLSFPMLEYSAPGDFSKIGNEDRNPDTGEVLLGDIALCAPKIWEQAKEYGHGAKREFAFLIAHSMLHLFGYDHMEPEEAAIMENKQKAILDSLGIVR